MYIHTESKHKALQILHSIFLKQGAKKFGETNPNELNSGSTPVIVPAFVDNLHSKGGARKGKLKKGLVIGAQFRPNGRVAVATRVESARFVSRPAISCFGS